MANTATTTRIWRQSSRRCLPHAADRLRPTGTAAHHLLVRPPRTIRRRVSTSRSDSPQATPPCEHGRLADCGRVPRPQQRPVQPATSTSATMAALISGLAWRLAGVAAPHPSPRPHRRRPAAVCLPQVPGAWWSRPLSRPMIGTGRRGPPAPGSMPRWTSVRYRCIRNHSTSATQHAGRSRFRSAPDRPSTCTSAPGAPVCSARPSGVSLRRQPGPQPRTSARDPG